MPAEIVAFDFDGTLTTTDSYTAFLRWRTGGARYALGALRLLPALLSYPVRRDRGALKAAATATYLGGLDAESLAIEAEAFAASPAGAILRPDALAVWDGWAGRGVVRAVVTASPEATVTPFARRLRADALIGTRLEFDAKDRVTGRFVGANCRGAEKVARIRQTFGDDVRIVAAYGDTSGDREMLAAAEEAHFRVFKGIPQPSSS